MSGKHLPIVLISILAASSAFADRFLGFNNTTSTVFTGVYLAPHKTGAWGPNEALNDKDKTWEPGERLVIHSASRGLFDLKIVDQSGHTCLKPGIDLSRDSTFEVRDEDLRACNR